MTVIIGKNDRREARAENILANRAAAGPTPPRPPKMTPVWPPGRPVKPAGDSAEISPAAREAAAAPTTPAPAPSGAIVPIPGLPGQGTPNGAVAAQEPAQAVPAPQAATPPPKPAPAAPKAAKPRLVADKAIAAEATDHGLKLRFIGKPQLGLTTVLAQIDVFTAQKVPLSARAGATGLLVVTGHGHDGKSYSLGELSNPGAKAAVNPFKEPAPRTAGPEPAKTKEKAVPKTKTAKAAKAKAPKKERPASLLTLAYEILKKTEAKALDCKTIVERAMAKGWKTEGKTPSQTLYAAIITEIKKKGKASRFKKVEAGQFAAA